MTSYDRLWVGSWLSMVVGIADDNLTLKIIALFMFMLTLLKRSESTP